MDRQAPLRGRAMLYRGRFLFAPVVAVTLIAGAWWTDDRSSRSASLLHRFGLRWTDLGQPTQWFRIFTSPYVQPGGSLSVSLLGLLVLLAVAEFRLGTRRVIEAFAATDIISTLTVLVVMRTVESGGSTWAAVIHQRDGGASSGAIGVVAALVGSIRNRWWQAAVAALGASLLVYAVIGSTEVADRQHLAAAAVGWLLATINHWRMSDSSLPPPVDVLTNRFSDDV